MLHHIRESENATLPRQHPSNRLHGGAIVRDSVQVFAGDVVVLAWFHDHGLVVDLVLELKIAGFDVVLVVVEQGCGADVFVQRAFDVPGAAVVAWLLWCEVDVCEFEDDFEPVWEIPRDVSSMRPMLFFMLCEGCEGFMGVWLR